MGKHTDTPIVLHDALDPVMAHLARQQWWVETGAANRCETCGHMRGNDADTHTDTVEAAANQVAMLIERIMQERVHIADNSSVEAILRQTYDRLVVHLDELWSEVDNVAV